MRRPRFIAEQARNASGPLGRLIAFIMARETWAQNERAIAALDVAEGDQVLDVGCGPGRSLAALGARARRGRVVGADPSDLMAEIAANRNRALIRAGRAEVVIAGAEHLPFADASFDKALCVHVIYFWDDLRTGFREIARVLKPGARFVLLFRSTLDQTAVNSFPPEVYRFRDVAEVSEALLAEGFAVELEAAPAETPQSPHLIRARRGA